MFLSFRCHHVAAWLVDVMRRNLAQYPLVLHVMRKLSHKHPKLFHGRLKHILICKELWFVTRLGHPIVKPLLPCGKRQLLLIAYQLAVGHFRNGFALSKQMVVCIIKAVSTHNVGRHTWHQHPVGIKLKFPYFDLLPRQMKIQAKNRYLNGCDSKCLYSKNEI